MYKNIIFDLGGVVVDFKPRDFLMDHFLNKSAEDEVFDLTFGSKEWEEPVSYTHLTLPTN